MFRHTSIKIAAVLFGSALAVGMVQWKSMLDRSTALERFRAVSHQEAVDVSKSIAGAFEHIYSNIRTISFLPGVRRLDRNGTNLDADGKAAIQQIYNNLASSVAVSEVYIVPVDFNPDALDPVTGKAQEPIMMFDELIVGAGKPKTSEAEEPSEHLEEVETEEYKLLVEQMAMLKTKFSQQSSIDGMNVPLVSGREVLTCDNTEFAVTRKDADRKGVMLTVPFFDAEGRLKGGVSAIIRSNALRDLLPKSGAALSNITHGFSVLSPEPGIQGDAKQAIAAGKAEDKLLFSTSLQVKTADISGGWTYWTGLSDDQFEAGPEMTAITSFNWLANGAIIFVALCLITVFSSAHRNTVRLADERKRLSETLNARTAEIEAMIADRAEASNRLWRDGTVADISRRFEQTLQASLRSLGGTSEVLGTAARSSVEIATNTSRQSHNVRAASEQASQSAERVAFAANQVSNAIDEISRKAALSAETIESAYTLSETANASARAVDERCEAIGGLVGRINRIASLINLLALNATIEAARAGDAGRGFAVVAREVKDLSHEVARVSEEITSRVAEAIGAAGKSIGHVDETVASLHNIGSNTQAIAASLEEQRAAVNEIATRIQEAAAGIKLITNEMQAMAGQSDAADKGALSVLAAAEDLKTLAATLEAGAGAFLGAVRAA
jgi:methyl-accepting chemotaxis protein